MKQALAILATGFFAILLISVSTLSAPRKSSAAPGQTALIRDYDTRLDCNNLEMFVYNDGNFAYDKANVLAKTDGLYFPRGTKKTVVYSAGIWVGALVNGDIRLAIAEYSSEFVPGPMNNGTFMPDNAGFRVYKINAGDTPASNPDYANWPADQGAPVDGSGKPRVTGHQTTWSVYNDADPVQHSNDAASTLPLGIEIQQTTMGYTRAGALGNAYFVKFKIINKGGNNLQDTYVSIWADPDLGSASDDLVGCDTMLSLGYCYNEGADAVYGAAPPAVGFDFLQGPIIPGEPEDSALVDGTWRHGFRNLPMTSFNKYINGTDPASAIETYGYMRGLTKDPISGEMIPMINPFTMTPTTFAVSGDPVTQTGLIDAAAADRRFMLSAGPFNMAPEDTQEVIVAVVVAQGSDPISSITSLRAADSKIQLIHDLNFNIPNAEPIVSVFSRGLDGQIELFWSGEMVGTVIYSSTLNEEYHFEGFNIFQGQTKLGPWRKIATYDVVNDVALIYEDVIDPIAGGTQRIIVQSGTNSGLQFHQVVGYDAFTNQPLQNDSSYHFGVSGYFYDVRHMVEFNDLGGNFLGYLTPVIESQIVMVEEMPTSNPTAVTDTAIHIAGTSDGKILIEWIDPSAATGHDYRVNFNAQDNWNLIDFSTGMTLLSNQQNQSGDFNYPIMDGFMIRVIGPQPGVKSVQEVVNAYGPMNTPNNVNYSLNSTGDWYMDPQGDHKLARYAWRGAPSNDFEIRMTDGSNTHLLDFLGQGEYSYVLPYLSPIEVWDIGVGTPNDPSDDRQIAYMNLDDDGSNSLGWGDGIYLWDIDYDAVPWSQPGWHTGMLDPNTEGLHLGRFRFEDNSGEYPFVPVGTVVRITTNKPNSEADIFAFSTGYDCGDVDHNKQVDITDIVYLINYIFANGIPPQDLGDADVDCNARINITDCVYMINYIFAGGPTPCAACQSM